MGYRVHIGSLLGQLVTETKPSTIHHLYISKEENNMGVLYGTTSPLAFDTETSFQADTLFYGCLHNIYVYNVT